MRPPLQSWLFRLTAAGLLLPAATARASFLSGDALDTFAGYMAWVVICVVPIGLIIVFWKLHVLPEKIAEARHHPQKDAIHVLCLLSLMVGGLLWPLAWLWAYTRPVAFKAAYGTEKHEELLRGNGGQGQGGRAAESGNRAPAR